MRFLLNKKLCSIIVLSLVITITSGLSVFMCGCTSMQASHELKESLDKKNFPRAVSFIEENIPGAEKITVEEEGPSIYQVFSDIVWGTYETDGTECSYHLNVETGECATSEMFMMYQDSLSWYVTDFLPEGFEYRKTDIQTDTEGEYILGHVISDQSWAGSRPETEVYEDEAYAHNELFLADKKEIQKRAIADAENNPVYVTIYTDNPDAAAEVFGDLSVIREHPKWKIVIRNDNPDEYYSMLCYDDRYYLIWNYVDEKGEDQKEYIRDED